MAMCKSGCSKLEGLEDSALAGITMKMTAIQPFCHFSRSASRAARDALWRIENYGATHFRGHEHIFNISRTKSWSHFPILQGWNCSITTAS
jgi:hypothetical protein